MAKPENRAFYNSARWKRVRTKAISRDKGLCVKCRRRGKVKAGEEVDHIYPVDKYPRLAFKLSNLQYLCRSCHVKKTNADKLESIEICDHGYPEGVCCLGGIPVEPATGTLT